MPGSLPANRLAEVRFDAVGALNRDNASGHTMADKSKVLPVLQEMDDGMSAAETAILNVLAAGEKTWLNNDKKEARRILAKIATARYLHSEELI